MIPPMKRPLVLAAALIVFIACGKKEKTPPVPTTNNNPAPKADNPEPKKPSGSSSVPQAFKDRIATAWPAIEDKGNRFLGKFKEAQTHQRSGDRAKMQSAIEDASKLFRDAKDEWAVIVYWVVDEEDAGRLTEKGAEACNRHLRQYERRVKDWEKKAKALKELSTVR